MYLVKSLIHYFKRVGPQRRSSLEVEVIQSSSNVRGREAQNVSSNTTEEKPRQQPHAKRRRVDGDDDGESTPPMHPSPEESAGCESSDASPIVETVLTDIESPNPSAAIGSEKEPHVPMDVDVAEHETIVDANPDHVSGDEAAESTAVDGAGSNTKDGTSDTLSDTGKGSLNAPEMEVEVDSGAPSPEGMSHSDRLPLQGSSSKENSPHSHERSAIGGRRMMVTLSSLKVPATPVRGKSSGDESVSKKTPAVSPIRQRVGLRNSYMVTRSKGKTSKTMSSSLSSDDEDLCAKKVVEDSSDDDLMAPVPFGLGTDSRGERRSGRNRGAINYAEPPLDPFKDRVLLESAKKVGRLSTSVKKPMFSLDVLLRDKKKRDAKQTEVNKLLEALKTMEDKEDSTSVDPLDDADLRAELSDEADDAIREYLKQPKTSKKMISYLAAIDISQDLVFKQKDPPATLPVTWRKALQGGPS
ncbi:hypothetical protein DFS34DRAFT_452428 [Phlyctochytrium arcticum]|nr:hypothetical protein DFS34DRAFT_452428 [Phlyctochytrium arcticum]